MITTTTTLSRPVSAAVELQLTVPRTPLFGAIIGKAEMLGVSGTILGVRTMALVATGAACFTVCSMYGFASAGSVLRLTVRSQSHGFQRGVRGRIHWGRGHHHNGGNSEQWECE